MDGKDRNQIRIQFYFFHRYQQVEVKLPKSIVISFIESFTNPVVYLES